jgi:hypothetical protein
MEYDAGLIVAEAERLLMADDVDLVAAGGETLGQLGGDDAAAAH